MRKLSVIVAGLAAVVAMSGIAVAAPSGAGLKAPLAELPLLQTQARGGRGFGRCVAIGVTRGGRRIPGVRGVAEGAFPRVVCRRALERCNGDLARLQRRGLNPFGRCVVR